MHERISIHSICFPTTDLSEVASYWRTLGARRVSLLSPMLDDGVAPVKAVLGAGRHKLQAVTHKFTEDHLSARRDWKLERTRLARVIDAVAALGGRSVYLVTGGHGDLAWDEAAEIFAEAIAPCLELGEKAGIRLMLEPIPVLHAEGHIAHSLGDTLALAERSGLGVCIDIFSCWAERGLREAIERAAPRCHLVQVGDYVFGDRSYPCRAVPGEGNLPLRRIIGWILDAGYQGHFDIEVFGPRIAGIGHVEAVRRSADYLGRLLDELDAGQAVAAR